MNFKNFVQACELRMPVVIVLTEADYRQLITEMDFYKCDASTEWNREKMQFHGRPIVLSGCAMQSYMVEDSPEIPLIHFIG